MATLYDINRRLSNLLDLAEIIGDGVKIDEAPVLNQESFEFFESCVVPHNGTYYLSVQHWQEAVAQIMADADEKVEAIAHVIVDAKGDVERIKAERERLARRKESRERLIARLEELITATIGREKWKSKKSPLQISSRRSEFVDIVDADILPESMVTTKIEKNPSKTAIKNALKAGVDVPGARLGERWSLQIK